MDLCFKNILYDNSLDKPKGTHSKKRSKYPGMTSLVQSLKQKYGEKVKTQGNLIVIDNNQYIVRFRSYGWAFGGISDVKDEAVIILIVSASGSELSEKCNMIIKKYKDIPKKSGSWNLKKEDLKDKKTFLNVDELNEEIIKLIDTDYQTGVSI